MFGRLHTLKVDPGRRLQHKRWPMKRRWSSRRGAHQRCRPVQVPVCSRRFPGTCFKENCNRSGDENEVECLATLREVFTEGNLGATLDHVCHRHLNSIADHISLHIKKLPTEGLKARLLALWANRGSRADTPERVLRVKRLLYTWKDCFALTLRDIKATDLIEHSTDSKPNARPAYGRIPKYNRKEREFAAYIFPMMEEAGIIVRAASDWGARSKFPPKKKGSEDLRVVHNFIPLNEQTVKPQYPMHRMEEVVEMIISPNFNVFFGTEAANG